MDKPFVFDKPLVKTQKFEVSMPNQGYRITVIRKEVIRKIHHMGCTDNLPDDYVENRISYDIFKEVDLNTKQKAIDAVEEEIKKNG